MEDCAHVDDYRYEGYITNIVDPLVLGHSATEEDYHCPIGTLVSLSFQMTADIERMLTFPTVVGFRDIALDYHRSTVVVREVQKACFGVLLKGCQNQETHIFSERGLQR